MYIFSIKAFFIFHKRRQRHKNALDGRNSFYGLNISLIYLWQIMYLTCITCLVWPSPYLIYALVGKSIGDKGTKLSSFTKFVDDNLSIVQLDYHDFLFLFFFKKIKVLRRDAYSWFMFCEQNCMELWKTYILKCGCLFMYLEYISNFIRSPLIPF